MDLLKLFVESYVQFIGHVAWPVAIVAILFIFRKPIVDKLRGLTKASKGDASLEFAIGLQEMIDKKKPKLYEITKDSLDWEAYLDILEQWAAWISFYINEWRSNRREGAKSYADYKNIEFVMDFFDELINKIQKERAGSGYLGPLINTRNRIRTDFENSKSAQV